MAHFLFLENVISISQTIFTFIIVLGVLIFFHEMGHFLAAKRFGVYVEEFALGFGPKIFSRKRGETVYSVRAFPLGGFCKLLGEMPEDEEIDQERQKVIKKATEDERCFFQKPAYKRLIIIAMGPLMNVFLAILVFFLAFAFFGIPVDALDSTVLGDVIPTMPAHEAGIRAGDKIVAIEGQVVDSWDNMAGKINKSPGQELTIQVNRRGELLTFQLTPETNEQGAGVIGIYPQWIREKVPIWESLKLGVQNTWFVTEAIFIGISEMITGRAPADIGGPVRIAQMVGEAARVGILNVMNLTAIISINLAIINLLPIPALDGGRLIFILLEMVRGKAVDPQKEGYAHFIGFVFLIILIVIIIIRDITQIF